MTAKMTVVHHRLGQVLGALVRTSLPDAPKPEEIAKEGLSVHDPSAYSTKLTVPAADLRTTSVDFTPALLFAPTRYLMVNDVPAVSVITPPTPSTAGGAAGELKVELTAASTSTPPKINDKVALVVENDASNFRSTYEATAADDGTGKGEVKLTAVVPAATYEILIFVPGCTPIFSSATVT